MERLVSALALSEEEIEKSIAEDINEACGIRPYRNKKAVSEEEKYPENHYQLIGVSYSYHVVADDSYLKILNAMPLPISALEGLREHHYNPNYLFSFNKPVNLGHAKSIIQDLSGAENSKAGI